MHLHLLPGIFQTVVELGKKHKIKGIRLPRGTFHWRGLPYLGGFAKQLVLCGLSLMQARHVRSAELFRPDYLCGIAESGQMTEGALRRTLSSLKPGITEIMVHPGYHDGEIERWPLSRRYSRERELVGLTSLQVKELIKRLQIELVSYQTVHL
jgi:predicted glycoside hydrolase/deacetylase ChbG (UPF0249 family)